MPPSALPVNWKVAVLLLLTAVGLAVIVVSGGTVSITQVNEAIAPVLPALSIARTRKVCAPSARPL